jgi:hypothetical protein
VPWTNPETFTAGQTLTAASMNVISGDLNALYAPVRRLGYQSRTTSYTTTSGVAPGPANIFTTSISWTADGTSAYRCEFYAPSASTATNAGAFIVVTFTTDTGTELCRLTQTAFGDGTRAAIAPQYAVFLYTPSAGTATLNVRAYHGTAAGTVDAGAGGSALAPMFMSVYGPALA